MPATLSLDAVLDQTLQDLRNSGQYKQATVLQSPQGPAVRMDGMEDVVMLSSNNYLGLAGDKRVAEAAKRAIDEFGLGPASVRFITGTMPCHLELENKIAEFLGVEAALTYISCWDANVAVIPTLASTPEDAIFSDALNHASIIDAIRLSKAQRHIYKHGDLAALEEALKKAPDYRVKLIITDGVFSMEGDIAELPRLKQLADQYGATLIVDESHATGVLGKGGRGTTEHFGLLGTGIIQISTLGKALGGACGGYVAASRTVVDYLIQKSRPSLFSNALPPAVCRGSMAALDILMQEPQRLTNLRQNAAHFRKNIEALGLKTIPGPTPIIPVMVGDTALAIRFQKALLQQGVFVSGFGYPVVPQGEARLRCQVSAAHTTQQLDKAVEAFGRVGKQLGVIK